MGSIKTEHLDKSFAIVTDCQIRDLLFDKVDEIKILKDVNLHVEPGQIHGVLGKNGAGKSTLLRTLGGIYQYEGTIIIDGSINSIFELGNLLNKNQTGEEYCREYFYYTMEKYDAEVVSKIIKDIHKFTELEDYFYEPVYTYSSGMKAKLLFAVVTAVPAEIILIDEALVVGDGYFQGKAWRRLNHMIHEGTAGIVVSHDWVALLRICKQAFIMEQGVITYKGDIRDAVRKYIKFEPTQSDKIAIHKKDELKERLIKWQGSGEFQFEIDVFEIPKSKDLEINVFIERFYPGIGWNVIYTNGSYFKVENEGLYAVRVSFPDLKLEEGEYGIEIHLMENFMHKKVGVALCYDRMTWIEETNISLRIGAGRSHKEIFKRRLKWKTKQA